MYFSDNIEKHQCVGTTVLSICLCIILSYTGRYDMQIAYTCSVCVCTGSLPDVVLKLDQECKLCNN